MAALVEGVAGFLGIVIVVIGLPILGYLLGSLVIIFVYGRKWKDFRGQNVFLTFASSFLLILPIVAAIALYSDITTAHSRNGIISDDMIPFIAMFVIPIIIMIIWRLRVPHRELLLNDASTYSNRKWLRKNGYWSFAEEFAKEAVMPVVDKSNPISVAFSLLSPITVVFGTNMFAVLNGKISLTVLPYHNAERVYKETNVVKMKRSGVKIQEKHHLVIVYSNGMQKVNQPLDKDIQLILKHLLDHSPNLIIK